ncbi:hypothetical protein L204_100583 [Cryptococcus depauperatus]
MTDTVSDSVGPVDILSVLDLSEQSTPIFSKSREKLESLLLLDSTMLSMRQQVVTLDTERFGKLDNWKPYRVFRSQKEALEDGACYSLCIVCTKYWRLQLDNGFGIEQDLYHGLEGQDIPIISSCAWIGIMNSLDGKVVHWRGQDTLVNSIRFSKNVWNCTWASVQGLVRTTVLAFAHLSHEHAEVIKAYFREIVTVGQGLENAVQYCWEKITGMTVQRGVGHKYSLLVVVEMGRPFEVEVIVGSVLDLVQKHDVPVPKLEFIYVFIKGPSERNYLAAATEDWKQLFWGIERVKWSWCIEFLGFVSNDTYVQF